MATGLWFFLYRNNHLIQPTQGSDRELMVPSWLLDEIAQQLESQAERRQIHQLAFAVNQQRWPEDPNLLDLYRLRDLVQDLTRSYGSFEELKQALRQALSQAPEGKALVPAARTLLKASRQAYQGDSSAAALPSDSSLGGFTTSEPAARQLSPFETRASDSHSHPFPPLPYDEIASTLEQSPSATRIKKLLYAVCSGGWTNDPIMLGRFRLTNLLKQLHRMSADEEALHNALRNVVVTLNRQMEYELVAQLIQRECHRLYAPLEGLGNRQALLQSSASYEEEEFFSTGPSINPPGSGVDPVPLGFYDDGPEPTGSLLPMGSEAVDMDSSQGLMGEASSPSSGAWVSPDYNPAYAQSPQGQSTQAKSIQAQSAQVQAAPVQQQARPLDWQGLAELRVELMRYANPLRVKTLMFSTLYYPFDLKADGDWSKLQTETLGDLILRLTDQFKSHNSLDEQLKLMACQLMPSDEYGSAAGAIARALRPFYP